MLDGLMALWLYSGLLMLVSEYDGWVLHGLWRQTYILTRVHDRRVAQQRLSAQLKTFLAACSGQRATLRINDATERGTVLFECQKNHKMRYRLQKRGMHAGLGLYARLGKNPHYQLMVPEIKQWQLQCLGPSNRWHDCHPGRDAIRMVRMILIPSNRWPTGPVQDRRSAPWSVLINHNGGWMIASNNPAQHRS